MIPYEQLVSALTSWRQRHGLPTASADLFGDTPGLPLGELPGGDAHAHHDEVAELGHDDVAEEMADDAVVEEADGAMYADPEATSIGSAGDYTAVAEYENEGDVSDLGDALSDDTGDEPGR